ncbi:hypothetical protein I656_00075 [Geobacillus sp. WSUCF1]|nr:hypothetical protein I656_00075 [Geobacillus sp. WSUCF1]
MILLTSFFIHDHHSFHLNVGIYHSLQTFNILILDYSQYPSFFILMHSLIIICRP